MVRLTVRGGGGSATSALTVSKCENFDFFHWYWILWHSKHIFSHCKGSQKCNFHALVVVVKMGSQERPARWWQASRCSSCPPARGHLLCSHRRWPPLKCLNCMASPPSLKNKRMWMRSGVRGTMSHSMDLRSPSNLWAELRHGWMISFQSDM